MINGCKMLDIYIMCSLLPIYNGPKARIECRMMVPGSVRQN